MRLNISVYTVVSNHITCSCVTAAPRQLSGSLICADCVILPKVEVEMKINLLQIQRTLASEVDGSVDTRKTVAAMPNRCPSPSLVEMLFYSSKYCIVENIKALDGGKN